MASRMKIIVWFLVLCFVWSWVKIKKKILMWFLICVYIYIFVLSNIGHLCLLICKRLFWKGQYEIENGSSCFVATCNHQSYLQKWKMGIGSYYFDKIIGVPSFKYVVVPISILEHQYLLCCFQRAREVPTWYMNLGKTNNRVIFFFFERIIEWF